ncbi:MAG: tRNA (adenosine(37)-N6)-dimethylallyltransferase MiaA [Patescibacteria group bacterium]|nr:tRNA (adenosine(37)-N6)-dimethylallyltransferase MiaA [Patescibacteria group bacterium]
MIVITGQTGTGKTKLALRYAKRYHGELVNFDSRQLYRHLDIITGKDLNDYKKSKFYLIKKENKLTFGYYQIETFIEDQPFKTKIWLYDLVSPKDQFSSFEFVQVAKEVIKIINEQGKAPILVGGSYFYLKHLLYGFNIQASPKPQLRKNLNKKSVSELQQILSRLNPETFLSMNSSDRNNPRRLIRKIEIFSSSKPTNVTQTKEQKIKPTIFIGLRFKTKNNVYQTLKARVKKRIDQGAVNEVKKLLDMGYRKTDPGLQTIGYESLIEYLEGKISLEQAIEKWLTAEVQYAKRQLTFMKKDPNIHWLEV